jgi:hypothetical protein
MRTDPSLVVRDPQIAVGPLRVLPRTDGRWIVFDERAPLGKMDVYVGATQADAIDAAKRLILPAEGDALPALERRALDPEDLDENLEVADR